MPRGCPLSRCKIDRKALSLGPGNVSIRFPSRVLTSLNLSRNRLDAAAGEALASALEVKGMLDLHGHISGNSLGEKGMSFI
jgi:hypothetical protein